MRERVAITASREDRNAALLVVHLDGDLDAYSAPQLRSFLIEHAIDGVRAVEIDLTLVAFVDSSGLVALVDTRQQLAGDGIELRLARPTTSVRRVLDITGLAAPFGLL